MEHIVKKARKRDRCFEQSEKAVYLNIVTELLLVYTSRISVIQTVKVFGHRLEDSLSS